MPKARTTKTVEFLRIGNGWLVGKHVGRIVPIFVLQNLIAPDLERDPNLQAIKHLAFDVDMAIENGLGDRLPNDAAGREFLAATVFGLLSPERRIFRDRRKGGAGKEGSLFPLVGGLVAPTGSDDSLGRRLRELMEAHDTDWRDRLKKLMLPNQAQDPATAFAMILLGGSSGHSKDGAPTKPKKKKLSPFESFCATFVDNLISPIQDGRRIPAIRNLATGSYLISLLHLVSAVSAQKRKAAPVVFVYGDLPPGRPDDPIVRAASQSFQNWLSTSWQATAETICERMDNTPTLRKATTAEKREQQLRQLLSAQIPTRMQLVDDILEALKFSFSLQRTGPAWAGHVMKSRQVGFSMAEFTRRVRSLGANIGFAGPDRGFGNPRLYLDTPLLGVLTKGVIGNKGSMDFAEFVTELARQFGLVLGLGTETTLADDIGLVGSGGLDPDEILVRNQEHFRKRLVRVGLAHTYSDSHTEVIADV